MIYLTYFHIDQFRQHFMIVFAILFQSKLLILLLFMHDSKSDFLLLAILIGGNNLTSNKAKLA